MYFQELHKLLTINTGRANGLLQRYLDIERFQNFLDRRPRSSDDEKLIKSGIVPTAMLPAQDLDVVELLDYEISEKIAQEFDDSVADSLEASHRRHRQKLTSSTSALSSKFGKKIKLSQELIETVLQLSQGLDLNELDCLSLVLSACSDGIPGLMGVSGQQFSSRDDLLLAAIALYGSERLHMLQFLSDSLILINNYSYGGNINTRGDEEDEDHTTLQEITARKEKVDALRNFWLSILGEELLLSQPMNGVKPPSLDRITFPMKIMYTIQALVSEYQGKSGPLVNGKSSTEPSKVSLQSAGDTSVGGEFLSKLSETCRKRYLSSLQRERRICGELFYLISHIHCLNRIEVQSLVLFLRSTSFDAEDEYIGFVLLLAAMASFNLDEDGDFWQEGLALFGDKAFVEWMNKELGVSFTETEIQSRSIPPPKWAVSTAKSSVYYILLISWSLYLLQTIKVRHNLANMFGIDLSSLLGETFNPHSVFHAILTASKNTITYQYLDRNVRACMQSCDRSFVNFLGIFGESSSASSTTGTDNLPSVPVFYSGKSERYTSVAFESTFVKLQIRSWLDKLIKYGWDGPLYQLKKSDELYISKQNTIVDPKPRSTEYIIFLLIQVYGLDGAENEDAGLHFWTRDSPYHAYLLSLGELQSYPHLCMLYLYLLASMSLGPRSASQCYEYLAYLSQGEGIVASFNSFWNILDRVTGMLKGSDTSPNNVSGGSVSPALYHSSGQIKEIANEDVAVIIVFLRLVRTLLRRYGDVSVTVSEANYGIGSTKSISNKSKNSTIASLLFDNASWKVVRSLSILASSSVTVSLKAECLATLSEISWSDFYKSCQICYFFSSLSTPNEPWLGFVSGLQNELESIEVREEQFPQTVAFLSFIEGIYASINSINDVIFLFPAVEPVFDYVSKVLLRNYWHRTYSNPLERFKIANGILQVFHGWIRTLQYYMDNFSESDPRFQENVRRLPGYRLVMDMMKRDSRIMIEIMRIVTLPFDEDQLLFVNSTSVFEFLLANPILGFAKEYEQLVNLSLDLFDFAMDVSGYVGRLVNQSEPGYDDLFWYVRTNPKFIHALGAIMATPTVIDSKICIKAISLFNKRLLPAGLGLLSFAAKVWKSWTHFPSIIKVGLEERLSDSFRDHSNTIRVQLLDFLNSCMRLEARQILQLLLFKGKDDVTNNATSCLFESIFALFIQECVDQESSEIGPFEEKVSEFLFLSCKLDPRLLDTMEAIRSDFFLSVFQIICGNGNSGNRDNVHNCFFLSQCLSIISLKFHLYINFENKYNALHIYPIFEASSLGMVTKSLLQQYSLFDILALSSTVSGDKVNDILQVGLGWMESICNFAKVVVKCYNREEDMGYLWDLVDAIIWYLDGHAGGEDFVTLRLDQRISSDPSSTLESDVEDTCLVLTVTEDFINPFLTVILSVICRIRELCSSESAVSSETMGCRRWFNCFQRVLQLQDQLFDQSPLSLFGGKIRIRFSLVNSERIQASFASIYLCIVGQMQRLMDGESEDAVMVFDTRDGREKFSRLIHRLEAGSFSSSLTVNKASNMQALHRTLEICQDRYFSGNRLKEAISRVHFLLQSLSDASGNGDGDPSSLSVTILCEIESLLSLLTQADPACFSLSHEIGSLFLSGLESSFTSIDERYLNEPFVQLLFGLINTVIGDWMSNESVAELVRHSNRAESAIWPWLSKFDDSLLLILKHSVNSICSAQRNLSSEPSNSSSSLTLSVGGEEVNASKPDSLAEIALQDALLLTLWIMRLYVKVPRAVKGRRLQPILETILKHLVQFPVLISLSGKSDSNNFNLSSTPIQRQWEAVSVTALELNLKMTMDAHSSKSESSRSGNISNSSNSSNISNSGNTLFCPPELWQRAIETVLKNSIDALNIQTCLALIIRSSVNFHNSDWHRASLFAGPSAGTFLLDRSRWENIVSGDPEQLATIDYMIRKLGIDINGAGISIGNARS